MAGPAANVTMLRAKSYYYRLFLSYLALLLVPLAVLGAAFHLLFLNTFRAETVKHNERLLRSVQASLDTRIAALSEIAARVAENRWLTPYAATRSPVYRMNAMAELSAYVSANDFVEEIAYYVRGDDLILTSASSYTHETFARAVFAFNGISADEVRATMERIAEPATFPVTEVTTGIGRSTRYATFLFPVPPDVAEPYATIAFFVNESAFSASIGASLRGSTGITVVLAPSDEPIYLSSSDPPPEAAVLREVGARLHAEPLVVATSTSGSRYAFASRSPTTGFTYVNLVPGRRVLAAVRWTQLAILGVIAASILIGFLVVLALARANYDPIASLKRDVERVTTGSSGEADELQGIRRAFTDVTRQAESLDRTIRSNNGALRHYYVWQLIKGRFGTRAEANARGAAIGVTLGAERFAVAVCSTARDDRCSTRDLIDAIESASTGASSAVAAERPGSDDVVIVLGLPEAADATSVVAVAAEALRRRHGWTLSAGIGRTYDGIGSVGSSYVEASTAFDYRVLHGSGVVIEFEKILSAHTATQSLPASEVAAVEQAMRVGDAAAVEEMLAEIVAALRREPMPLFIAKLACAEIVAGMLRVMHDYRIDPGSLECEIPDVTDAASFESVEEVVRRIGSVALATIATIRATRESGNTELHRSVERYLHENFTRFDFSVRGMADELGVSASYVSRYYRDQHGCTVTERLNEIRMQKARELLRTTRRSVTEIVAAVGYWDASSFIRKFKQIEGVTPGRYREIAVDGDPAHRDAAALGDAS